VLNESSLRSEAFGAKVQDFIISNEIKT
jgi:hypothetical protein